MRTISEMLIHINDMDIMALLKSPVFLEETAEYRRVVYEARLRSAAASMNYAIHTSNEILLTTNVKEFKLILQEKEGASAYMRMKLSGDFDGYVFLPYVLGSSE